MKIKKSVLEKVVREALYREVGKRAINEGKLNEFFGLFGGGKKKKKAAAPAPKPETAAEPATDDYTAERDQEKIDSVNAVIRKHYGSYAKDYLGPCGAAEGKYGHVPGLETGKRTFITDERYDKIKSTMPEIWTKENIDRWQRASC